MLGGNITPFLWILVVYLISSLLSRWLTSRPSQGRKRRGPVKKFFWSALWGLLSVLVADQMTPGEPFWPSITFITLVGGTLFQFLDGVRGLYGLKRAAMADRVPGETDSAMSLSRRSEIGLSGLGALFGGIFYLEPLLGIVALGLTLEIFLVGKDILTGIILFIGLIPILFQYAQLNRDFFWAALGTELLFAVFFRYELGTRIFSVFRNRRTKDDEDDNQR